MTQFETLTFARALPHPAAKVFAAFASSDVVKAWAAPDPRHEMVFHAADFRVGGRDHWTCGPDADHMVEVEGRYYDIVKAKRIVFTERLSFGGDLKSVTLVTNEFEEQNGGTQLTVTAQITALTDMDVRKGYESGYSAALDNLARYLATC